MHTIVYSIQQIANAIGAECRSSDETLKDFVLLSDSRTLTDPANSIFIALRTAFNDGHRFIPELIEKGVRYFIVADDFKEGSDTGNVYLKVSNTLSALQAIGRFHRMQFNLPVIGITGSNGKTIVKEWLLHLLGNDYLICANPKSYNSQIGVPLSVWQLKKEHTLGIFEAGISGKEEMEALESIIRPEIGVLTHLGTAHNEGFDDPMQKLDEKLKLFRNCKTVISQYNPVIFGKLGEKLLSFGFNEASASLNITETLKGRNSTLIRGEYQGLLIEFSIPFTDDASIENACLSCLITLFFDLFNAAAFYELRPVSMRMELLKGRHGCLIVNDSYSNDLNALSTALSFLKQQSIHLKNTVILSDIEESGLPREILYTQVRNLLSEKKINRLIGIGTDYMSMKHQFAEIEEKSFYENTGQMLMDFDQLKFSDESILIKGARKFGFEKIVRKLEQESHGTVLEINLSAALKNLNVIKQRIGSDVKVMAMVKAFAYGSGTYEIAKLLQKKVDYLAVAYADEAIALRKSGINTPVMVMNTDEETFNVLTEYNLEPAIFSISQLNSLHSELKGKPISIHIEIDTGMHRLGFVKEEIDELVSFIALHPELKVASVFSHFSASDEEQYDAFSKEQIREFHSAADKIEKVCAYKVIRHISNTAAALRFSQVNFGMVRLGIGLYGIDPTGKFGNLLEPVFTLKTHISQIKTIRKNESVGYARKSVSDKSRKIAVLALGYADGLNRALSNGKGGFYINGNYAEIAGNVCMDMCMVDVSNIDCEEGDEAILFGKEHKIEDIAIKLNTIPYEILTSISQRVKRVYTSE